MKKPEINFILRLFLSLVFIASAYSKIIAPGLLEIILVDHGIVTARGTAAILVRLLIGFEFSLAFLLLQKNYLKVILPVVFIFLSGFTVYLGYAALGLKDSQNCGCFGAVLKMSPAESIVKNIVLMAVTIILYCRIKSDGKRIVLPIVILLISLPAVFLIAPIKDNSGFVFGRYTSFIDAGRTDLSSGRKIVLLMSLDCDHCMQTAKDILELKKKYDLPDVYTLFFQESDATVDSFRAKTKFSSPYLILPGEEFFGLIGSTPPRCYYLNDGKVEGFWDQDIKGNIIKNILSETNEEKRQKSGYLP